MSHDILTDDKTFNPRGLKLGDMVTWADPEKHETTDRFKITGVEGRFGSKVFLAPLTPTTNRVLGSRNVNMFIKSPDGDGRSKDFPLFDLPNLNVVNDCLRFALNELRALDNPSTVDGEGDRKNCSLRLRQLADHIGLGGLPPDAESIIREAASIPIQE